MAPCWTRQLSPGHRGALTCARARSALEYVLAVDVHDHACENLRIPCDDLFRESGDCLAPSAAKVLLLFVLVVDPASCEPCLVDGFEGSRQPGIGQQRQLIDAAFEVMVPCGEILQYTYSLASPIKEKPLGLKGRRKGISMLNVPPAWVWSYAPAV